MNGKTHQFGLADRLRAAREGAGYDQSGLADALGISRGSVHNYETGRTVPRRPVLATWAAVTGYDLHWLETGQEPGPGRTRDPRARELVGV